MGRLYENAPLIEAICEFRFKPRQEWDWTIPGLVYDKIKTQFPKKRQQDVVEMEFTVASPALSQQLKGGVGRIQFFREDERALIQVGPDLLAVNHLKPYPTWEVFKAMIDDALKVYRQVAEPIGVQRIGLRYINRIELSEPQVQIEDYLLAYPQIPEPVPQVFARWVQRVEIPFEKSNGMLVLQSGSLHEEERVGVALILDLDLFTLQPDVVTLDAAMDWVERGHDEIEKTFEASITDKSRVLFKEIKEKIAP